MGKNAPFFLLPPRESRGGVLRAPAALGRRPWSSAAASGRGKRSRAALGTDSPPQFQRRGLAGRGAAAMAVAGRRRPWTAW